MRSIYRDWAFWAFLGLAVANLSVALKLVADFQHIKGQNQWSIEDRSELHSRQEQTVRTLKQLDDRSDYLDKTVRALIANEQARQERRKAEAKK